MRRGFTMVETIFSFFVVALVMMFVFQIFPGSLVATRQAECELQAEAVADAALEKARSAGFTRLGPDGTTGPTKVTMSGYEYEYQLDTFSPGNPIYIRGLRATVRWTFQGRSRKMVREVWMSNVKA